MNLVSLDRVFRQNVILHVFFCVAVVEHVGCFWNNVLEFLHSTASAGEREANKQLIQVSSKNPRRSEIDTEPTSIRAFGNTIPYNEKLLQQFK